MERGWGQWGEGGDVQGTRERIVSVKRGGGQQEYWREDEDNGNGRERMRTMGREERGWSQSVALALSITESWCTRRRV